MLFALLLSSFCFLPLSALLLLHGVADGSAVGDAGGGVTAMVMLVVVLL